jgi:hypothetical protein
MDTNDLFPDSGQTGGGTALPAVAAQTPTGVDAALRAVDHATAAVTAITEAGATVAQALEAATMQNQAPAPSDPVMQQLASLHARVTGVENVTNVLAGAIGAGAMGAGVSQTAAPIISRIGKVEAAVESLANFAETAAPLFERLKSLFAHFGGKF